MVYRGPDGKFRSGDDADGDVVSFYGGISMSIPAADLGGGNADADVSGSDAAIFDFDEELDDGEMFHVHHWDIVVSLALPTTATAESSALAEWRLTPSITDHPTSVPTAFYEPGVPAERSAGILDINQGQDSDEHVIAAGKLQAENSAADSATGIGLGADHAQDRVQVPGYGQTFDEFDALAVPTIFEVQNADDHGVVFEADVVVYGTIVDEDC